MYLVSSRSSMYYQLLIDLSIHIVWMTDIINASRIIVVETVAEQMYICPNEIECTKIQANIEYNYRIPTIWNKHTNCMVRLVMNGVFDGYCCCVLSVLEEALVTATTTTTKNSIKLYVFFFHRRDSGHVDADKDIRLSICIYRYTHIFNDVTQTKNYQPVVAVCDWSWIGTLTHKPWKKSAIFFSY